MTGEREFQRVIWFLKFTKNVNKSKYFVTKFLPVLLIGGSRTAAVEYFGLAVEHSEVADHRAWDGLAAVDPDVLASSSWSTFSFSLFALEENAIFNGNWWIYAWYPCYVGGLTHTLRLLITRGLF
jgi:hypothetical protein